MAIAFVNSTIASNDSGGTVSSLATVPTSLTTGNLIAVIVRNDTSNATAITISDTAGNTYTEIISASMDSGDAISFFYCADPTGNSSNIVTANFSPAASFTAVASLQFSGCNTIAPLDTSASGVVAGTASSVATNTFNTAIANEVVIAGFSVNSLSNTFTPASGYTLANTDNGGFVATEYQIFNSIQSGITAGASFNGTAGKWEIVAAAFKAAQAAQVEAYYRPIFKLGGQPWH